ncbi:hypothetical protein SSX86_012095 [Deinandra increscens subsp. villosa]|uniref:F-box domain-containing protein n=1 Tax=Deinandra increscens subsp. villosa TaxID=3103831 RepID=A0AAP0D3Z4_9ASTR
MGSGLSSFLLMCSSTTSVPIAPPEPGLGELPESVVGNILVYLSPPEICRLASLNRAFRRASSAEFVWELKLPENYDSLLSRVFGHNEFSCCKREIYARLSTPSSIDGGTKKVWLDKGTGKACVLISSIGLAITGIDDRRYWSWISTDESRFRSVAYLQQIWWFEVDGDIEFPFPCGTYTLYFRLHLGRSVRRYGRRVCNSDHVHGWDIKPVKFQLSTSDGQKAVTQCNLTNLGKWNLYQAGDFVVEDSNVPMKVKFSMTQIDCTHTKGGLCVDSVLIRPK